MLNPSLPYAQLSDDYHRVEQAIRYLEANYLDQPELDEVAASIGLSEYHFQRLFTRWVGISPKRFLQYLTKEHAKHLLRRSGSLLEAAYASGLSGPGRLHDLFVSTEAVTPGEYKQAGAGLEIRYGFHPTPFGLGLIALTQRGVCGLSFVEPGAQDSALAQMRSRWRNAAFIHDQDGTQPVVAQIFRPAGQSAGPMALYLIGTNFQIKVWEALLRIPSGSLVTYADIALAIGMPDAARAVGTAVGSNPIAVIIPCHRVIRKDGSYGEYHYGSARKKAILGWEFAGVDLASQAV